MYIHKCSNFIIFFNHYSNNFVPYTHLSLSLSNYDESVYFNSKKDMHDNKLSANVPKDMYMQYTHGWYLVDCSQTSWSIRENGIIIRQRSSEKFHFFFVFSRPPTLPYKTGKPNQQNDRRYKFLPSSSSYDRLRFWYGRWFQIIMNLVIAAIMSCHISYQVQREY